MFLAENEGSVSEAIQRAIMDACAGQPEEIQLKIVEALAAGGKPLLIRKEETIDVVIAGFEILSIAAERVTFDTPGYL